MPSLSKSNIALRDGDFCVVTGGTHKGKSGTVHDLRESKTGAVTITVVQANGEHFKTLAKKRLGQTLITTTSRSNLNATP